MGKIFDLTPKTAVRLCNVAIIFFLIVSLLAPLFGLVGPFVPNLFTSRGINVGIMRGENIRSASGLGYTGGGSGAVLHGAGLNIAYSDDWQTWTVDVGYNPGIAAEVHGGRINYPIVLIPGSD